MTHHWWTLIFSLIGLEFLSLCQLILTVENVRNEQARVRLEAQVPGQPRVWMRDWLMRRDTLNKGFVPLYEELYRKEPDVFKNFFGLTPESFKKLLAIIKPDIKKKDTRLRKAIKPRVRLMIYLKYV